MTAGAGPSVSEVLVPDWATCMRRGEAGSMHPLRSEEFCQGARPRALYMLIGERLTKEALLQLG